ncbi:MAG: saccharopine dehydrogenase NADP-binding domain-containing protein [Thermoprotei archaeon]
MGFRAAIVGCGAQGRVISTFFARDSTFSEIGLFDIKPEVCRAHVDALSNIDAKGNKVVEVAALNAGDSDDVARRLNGYDVLINAVIPRFNLDLMKASLKAGLHYVDMAFGPPYNNLGRQLKLSEGFRRTGLIGLIGAGKSPGLTNLLVAEAAELLDKVVSVKIRMGGNIESSQPVMTWSPKTLLEDCSIPPAYISGGRLLHAAPFSGEEEYLFPEPIGTRRVWLHEHEEAYMFNLSLKKKGLKRFDLKMGGLENIKALYDLGLIKQWDGGGSKRANPIEVIASLLPQPPTQEELLAMIRKGVIKGSCGVSVVEVEGEKAGSEAKVKLWVNDPNILDVVKSYPMATDDSYVVGLTCSVLAKTVLTHERTLRGGVYLPEALPSDLRRGVFNALSQQNPPILVNGRFEGSVRLAAQSATTP